MPPQLVRKDGTKSVTFQQLASPRDSRQIPAEIAKAVVMIAEYVSRPTSSIGARELLARHADCALSCFVREVLKARSIRLAVVNRFSSLSQPPRRKAVGQAALAMVDAIPSARSERVLSAAVYRFLFSDSWVSIRNRWEDIAVSGNLNLPPEKIANHKRVMTGWDRARSVMLKEFLDAKVPVTKELLERSFYEMATKSGELAAGWGFAVIGLHDDGAIFNQYVRPNAEHFLAKRLAESIDEEMATLRSKPSYRAQDEMRYRRLFDEQLRPIFAAKRADIEVKMKERGPYPANGWVLYATSLRFSASADAEKRTAVNDFSRGVSGTCPH